MLFLEIFTIETDLKVKLLRSKADIVVVLNNLVFTISKRRKKNVSPVVRNLLSLLLRHHKGSLEML